MGDPLLYCTNSINLTALVEKSNLISICNGHTYERHGCNTQVRFGIIFTASTDGEISFEGGWQGYHIHVYATDFSRRQTTSDLGNGYNTNDCLETGIMKTETEYDVINMRNIGISVVEGKSGFIQEGVTFTEVNNVVMDMSDPFNYLKEIHTKVEKFKCSNYEGACIPVPPGFMISLI